MVCSGDSADIGSWNTIEMRPPRSRRSNGSDARSAAMSTSPPAPAGSRNRIRPRTMRPAFGSRRRIDWAITDLPDPDSPTSASTRPRRSVKSTPRTASMWPPATAKDTCRSCTRSSSAPAAVERGGASASSAVVGMRCLGLGFVVVDDASHGGADGLLLRGRQRLARLLGQTHRDLAAGEADALALEQLADCRIHYLAHCPLITGARHELDADDHCR